MRNNKPRLERELERTALAELRRAGLYPVSDADLDRLKPVTNTDLQTADLDVLQRVAPLRRSATARR